MATKQQIPVVAVRLTEFQEEFSQLPTEDAQWVIMNGREAAKLVVDAIINRPKAEVELKSQAKTIILSEIIATVNIPATTEKFIAKDNFKVDTSRKATVKISYLGDYFKAWFLGKVEEPFLGGILYGRKLEKNSVDGPILSELGGADIAEITLTELYAAMAAQPNGKSGSLLTNGWANVFYIKDVNGTLRTVRVRWLDGGWYVSAASVEIPSECNAGRQVFFRNFSVAQAT